MNYKLSLYDLDRRVTWHTQAIRLPRTVSQRALRYQFYSCQLSLDFSSFRLSSVFSRKFFVKIILTIFKPRLLYKWKNKVKIDRFLHIISVSKKKVSRKILKFWIIHSKKFWSLFVFLAKMLYFGLSIFWEAILCDVPIIRLHTRKGIEIFGYS